MDSRENSLLFVRREVGGLREIEGSFLKFLESFKLVEASAPHKLGSPSSAGFEPSVAMLKKNGDKQRKKTRQKITKYLKYPKYLQDSQRKQRAVVLLF